MTREPADNEIPGLVDDAVAQVLGPRGLSSAIKKGDRVVIKINIVGPSQGLPGEKGRGIISDPRIVRYVAGKMRENIGFGETADLKVIDPNSYEDWPGKTVPSEKREAFYLQ
jgi:hypothetical protein